MDVRNLAEGEDGEHFGVHIVYSDLFHAMLFLAAIYAGGILSSRFLSLPSLVGEIFVGIAFGPSVLSLVPSPEAFVMLGEIGLILLVLEAGMDIDLTTIKLIGTRGICIAMVGSILPIVLAAGVAMALGYGGKAILAAGCVFSPTSLGIAMNILRQSNLVNTPVGQLIVAAAIIDDMVALVILSQLQAFTLEEVTIVDILIPVASAVVFLVGGGALAVFVLPKAIDNFILSRTDSLQVSRGWMSMAVMFVLLLLFMPMTYYGKASPLMGSFLAGLVFCSNGDVHHTFVQQFKRVMQWLLRIFFAASIGFQVPITSFGSTKVIVEGFLFTLALLGKIITGSMVPNFARTQRFSSSHLRDCLVVGFSMMAEGEFAFVIAVFAVTNGMLSKEQYASVVLAVLISTIVAPLSLRTTISRFNKQLEQTLKLASAEQNEDAKLEKGLKKATALFYCIQTKSASAWGLQTSIMQELSALNLDVIDHRSWHDDHTGVATNNVVVNEVYVQDTEGISSALDPYEREQKIENRANDIAQAITAVIGQEDAVVRTQRWIPVLPEGGLSEGRTSVAERIVRAANQAMEKRKKAKESLLHEDYASMDAVQQAQRDASMSPHGDHGQISHLDSQHKGHLEGFFRHDSSKGVHIYRPYQSRDDVELVDDGSPIYHSL